MDAKKASSELRICHLADIHLGYRRYNRLTKNGQNQREMDVNLAFREAISQIINLKPDLIIIAGDLFHHVRPTNSIITFCFREIRRLAQGSKAPVVIIAGNHEFPKRQDTGSALKILAEIDGVHVADSKTEVFTFPGINAAVTCMPHPSLLEENKGVVRADDRFKFNMLALHGQLSKEQISDFGGVEVDLKDFSQFEWDYIALGHLHEAKDIAINASYSGAIEHTSTNIWGEAGKEKGFLEIQLPSRKRTFHPLSSPRDVIVLDTINAEKMDAKEVLEEIEQSLTFIVGGIDGKIVRLEIENISREVQAALDHKRLRELRTRSLNFTLEMRAPNSEYNFASFNTEKPRKLNDELSEYCDAITDSSVPKDKIKTLLLDYLSKLEASNEINKFEP